MPWTQITRRSAVAALVGMLVGATLVGCGPVNAGSGYGSRFEQHMEALPGVVDATGGGQNTLPFSGSMSGRVEIAADVDATALRTITDEMGAWWVDNASASLDITSMDAVVGSVSFPVLPSRVDNETTLDLVALVRPLTGFTAIEVVDHGDGDQLGLTAQQAEGDPFAAVGVLAAARADDPRFARGSVSATAGDVTVRSDAGSIDPETRAAYDSVVSVATVTAADVGPDRLDVTLADRDDGRAVADLLSDEAATRDVTVTAGGIVRTVDGPLDRVEGLLAAATSSVGVVAAELSASALEVRTADGTDALAAATAMSASDAGAGIDVRSLPESGAASVGKYAAVGSDSADLGDGVDLVAALFGVDEVEAASLVDGELSVSVPGATIDSLRAVFTAAAPHLEPGSSVTVRSGRADADFVAEPGELDLPARATDTDDDSALRTLVADAWNATAPLGR